jgi:hypothetical protein
MPSASCGSMHKGEAHSPGAGLCIRNSLESLFHKGGMSVECLCPSAPLPLCFLSLLQDWGTKGVEKGIPPGLSPVSGPSIANSNHKALDCAGLCVDASIGMITGQMH